MKTLPFPPILSSYHLFFCLSSNPGIISFNCLHFLKFKSIFSVHFSHTSFSITLWRLLSSRLLMTLEFTKPKDLSLNLFYLVCSIQQKWVLPPLQDFHETPFSWLSYLAASFSISFSWSTFFCSSNVQRKESQVGKERNQIRWCIMDLASPSDQAWLIASSPRNIFQESTWIIASQDWLSKERKREKLICWFPFPTGQSLLQGYNSSSLPSCFYTGTEQVSVNRKSSGWKMIVNWEIGHCQVMPTKSQ